MRKLDYFENMVTKEKRYVFTCSKSSMKTPDQCLKSVQS